METYFGKPKELSVSDEISEAVIHPVLYRHIYKEGVDRFARFATAVWGIEEEGQNKETLAKVGIQALADFIKEIGLPSSFEEMGITQEDTIKKVADTCNISPGCCKQLSREELLEILQECM